MDTKKQKDLTKKQKDLVSELKFLLDSGNGLKASNLNSLLHKMPYKHLDRELALQLASHPSTTISALEKAFNYTFEFDPTNIDSLVSSYMDNVKFDGVVWSSLTFDGVVWSSLTGSMIRPTKYKNFLHSVATVLSKSSSTFDSKKLKTVLELAILDMTEEYEIKVCGRDTILAYFISIFDNINFSIDSVLAPLKDILLDPKFTPLMLDGTINEAMHKSKNATDIINYMFEITGNPDYLSQDVKDIFWFP